MKKIKNEKTEPVKEVKELPQCPLCLGAGKVDDLICEECKGKGTK